ncbi:MAG: hypothetical protein QM802_24435 [Agriterribacter sp.]
MTIQQTKQIINLLAHKGVLFEKGLSDLEVTQVQEKFQILFPPDLKLLLQTQLPISDRFVNWRQGLSDNEVAENIVDRLNWPLDGILWDLRNDAWLSIWGDKPKKHEDKVAIIKSCYSQVPKMVPIYSHRYIPSDPDNSGNPIFSIHQTDIIYYGFDLATYFSHEFYFELNDSFRIIDRPIRQIKFWSWCVDNLHP